MPRVHTRVRARPCRRRLRGREVFHSRVRRRPEGAPRAPGCRPHHGVARRQEASRAHWELRVRLQHLRPHARGQQFRVRALDACEWGGQASCEHRHRADACARARVCACAQGGRELSEGRKCRGLGACRGHLDPRRRLGFRGRRREAAPALCRPRDFPLPPYR